MANQPVDAVASLLKNLLESDKPQALALIQSAEGGAQAFIVNALRNTKLSGVQGMLYKILEPKLEDGVAQLIAKNGPEVVFDFIDAFLAKESVA